MITILLTTILIFSFQRPAAEIAADLERLASELRGVGVIEVPADGDLQTALTSATEGAEVRLPADSNFVGNFTISKRLKLIGDSTLTSPGGSPALTITGSDVEVTSLSITSTVEASTNDLVVLTGARINLRDINITGNGKTKRGIAANGTQMSLDNVQIRNIGRVGQESQAVAIWNGTGLIVRNSTLEAGSTPFLSGGDSPTVPNHIPSDLIFDDVIFTHNLAWRGQGYVNKTGFELKSGRRVIVRNSIIENVWVEGQTGWGITITPSQYGNSPETIVEDVLFDTVTVRNVGGGMNILGYSQHQTSTPPRPTLRSRNVIVRNSSFTISRAVYGGHGSLMQIGREPVNYRWENNTVTMDGAAFIRTSDNRPIVDLTFTGNTVNPSGTYGIWTPAGSRGCVAPCWLTTTFPNLVITGNTFFGAHSIFRTTFPSNSWQ